MSIFFENYLKRKKEVGSLLCVGLDPLPERLPQGYYDQTSDPIGACEEFLGDVIRASRNFAVAYKPNCAFFEALGPAGMELFARIVRLLRYEAPGALIIADAKRSDIVHSAAAYARSFFEQLDCDALTVNPYMGMDCLEAFISYATKATIVLCHTSNPGAAHFQSQGEPKLYVQVARAVALRNEKSKNLWLVVGATKDVQSTVEIRQAAPRVPFLVPGVGQQKGANSKECIKTMGTNILINVGRSLIYAAKQRQELSEAIHKECQKLKEEMGTSS